VSIDLPEQLTESFLRHIRKQFYPAGRDGDKRFFQERRMLLQAITWPARWLDERVVRLTATRYKELLNTIISTIVRHGDVSKVRSFGRYLLHSIQEHMRHHGDEYYDVGKASRSLVTDVMLRVRQAKDAPRKIAPSPPWPKSTASSPPPNPARKNRLPNPRPTKDCCSDGSHVPPGAIQWRLQLGCTPPATRSRFNLRGARFFLKPLALRRHRTQKLLKPPLRDSLRRK